MNKNIEFKSKAFNVLNYKDVDISSFAQKFEPDKEDMEDKLLCLRKKYAQLVETDEVSIGDIVVLSCKSDNKRFNKQSVTVNVGKGLFSKELENNLSGMKKGEEKELVIKGDKVCVHIDKISRNTIPELTDEDIAKCNLEGIKTVKELKQIAANELCEEFLKEYAEQAMLFIGQQVTEKSSFELDEGELERTKHEGQKMARDMVKEQGVSLEEITEEQAQEIMGCSAEEFVAQIVGIFVDSLRTAIIGNMLMKEDGHPATIEGYEEEIERQAGSKGISIEEEKKSFSVEAYMKQVCGNYFFDTTEAYALNYLKEKEI